MTTRDAPHHHAPGAWWTMQVFYHQADKDDLIVRGAAPALAALQVDGTVGRAFVQRHWHHGPHLRINVEVRGDAAVARGALGGALERYCQAHPSGVALTEAAYLERYGKVAGYELLDQPLLPLYGNHAWRWQPLLMRDERYGSPGVARLSREVLSDLQPMVTALLARRPSAEERWLHFAGWMFTFAGAFRRCMDEMFGSVPSVALSFRSHAEGYYHNVPGGAGVRERFERTARQNLAALRAECHAALQDDGGPHAALRDVLERAAVSALALHGRGELHVFGPAEYAAAEQRLAPGVIRPAGSYGPRHAPLADPDSELSRLLREPEVQVRRWLVNLLYDRMMTAGCRPVERFALCELVASTVEAEYGPDDFLYPAPRPVGGWAS